MIFRSASPNLVNLEAGGFANLQKILPILSMQNKPHFWTFQQKIKIRKYFRFFFSNIFKLLFKKKSVSVNIAKLRSDIINFEVRCRSKIQLQSEIINLPSEMPLQNTTVRSSTFQSEIINFRLVSKWESSTFGVRATTFTMRTVCFKFNSIVSGSLASLQQYRGRGAALNRKEMVCPSAPRDFRGRKSNVPVVVSLLEFFSISTQLAPNPNLTLLWNYLLYDLQPRRRRERKK